MTNGQCRITTLSRPGSLAHSFRYEEAWKDSKIDFEFSAALLDGFGSTTYRVFLGIVLDKRLEYWTGSPRDNELLYHLMRNIRRGLCLLKGGASEETRIKTVEFALSTSRRWRSLSNFHSEEIVL
jgi:hypothetical protein